MQNRLNFCGNINCAYFGLAPEQIASMRARAMHTMPPTQMNGGMQQVPQMQMHGNHSQMPMHSHARCDVAREYPRPVIPCNNQLQISFATTPMQNNADTYSLKTALVQGTLFEALDMPYNKRIINRGYTFGRAR